MSLQYFENYLAKHSFCPRIATPPQGNFAISIVIPCFNEPDIIATLESLFNCVRPSCSVEVIVVVNYPEGSLPAIVNFHIETLQAVKLWTDLNSSPSFSFYVIDAAELPQKFAGVGLARKIGMDEAAHRFSLAGNGEGIISGFDADATVDTSYLKAIEEHFNNFSQSPGASIYFEHPLENVKDIKLRNGIVQYETHLRYLINAMRFTGFPYAFHTVGSSFAVRAKAYVKQGGMNRFKAGEDFYFINKIIPLGGYTEINSTRVAPQARVSNRVPFGTGASMNKWMAGDSCDFLTYRFSSFAPLRNLFAHLEQIYLQKTIRGEWLLDKALYEYLHENNADEAIAQCIKNSTSFVSFSKRFYNWFDAFKIVKYLNYAALGDYAKSPVFTEANNLIGVYNTIENIGSNEALLNIYRRWDRYGMDNI